MAILAGKFKLTGEFLSHPVLMFLMRKLLCSIAVFPCLRWRIICWRKILFCAQSVQNLFYFSWAYFSSLMGDALKTFGKHTNWVVWHPFFFELLKHMFWCTMQLILALKFKLAFLSFPSIVKCNNEVFYLRFLNVSSSI